MNVGDRKHSGAYIYLLCSSSRLLHVVVSWCFWLLAYSAPIQLHAKGRCIRWKSQDLPRFLLGVFGCFLLIAGTWCTAFFEALDAFLCFLCFFSQMFQLMKSPNQHTISAVQSANKIKTPRTKAFTCVDSCSCQWCSCLFGRVAIVHHRDIFAF